MATTKSHLLAEMRISASIKKANLEYALGSYALCEKTLIEATKIRGLNAEELEHLFNLLAGLASKQGMFATAAYWYLQVLQSRTLRKDCSRSLVSLTRKNYYSLLALSQRQNPSQDFVWFNAS